MKFTLAIASILAAVSAQSIPGLPTCGVSCMITAATGAKGCGFTDSKCFCGLPAITEALKTCVPQNCSATPADIKATYELANKSCAGAKGFTPLTPPA
ncbi:hypothetical protein BLS_001102 [Venturia inaequalis]|uniref:CFEM domain-containing protein n=1 Tax=Venturia inaequalis TaxID=5025 RepID=A0A8H3UZ06_VENIN|nr:hypothetical protein EG328_007689 [Venturia inaequalis]KAE9975227.1 hypothetical protein EG327_008511 [Venturia inaequalis]KAE9977823.1 hypothetical protein BLS_001102 [Venturia inaequalis]RDI85935.1 hypothetical protein Vi05172_g3964 [Venturia inaequalis]